MIKYLKYEFKKNVWALLIITAICAVPYVLEAATMEMWWESYDGRIVINRPNTSMLFVMLVILTFIVPVLSYSFKMNKRGVDGFYGLPIKREKLYFVKMLVGAALIVIPFTVAYWLGFFALLVRERNPYQMVYYVPMYFGYVGLGLLMFGFHSFLFTRANKIGDGVVFMLAYAPIMTLIMWYVEEAFSLDIPLQVEEGFTSWGALSAFDTNMVELIRSGTAYAKAWSAWTYVYYIVTGILGYVLLFLSIRFERAENAEQVSESWFGYKVIIPVYTAFMLAGNLGNSTSPLFVCLILVCAIIATIVYQRKFKFPARCWGMIAVGLIAGLVLNVFI